MGPSNLPDTMTESSVSYLKNYFVTQGFISDNQYEVLVGLLQKRTKNVKSAYFLAGALIQGATQQDLTMNEIIEFVRLSPDEEIDPFLAFFLNNTRIGTSYLGVSNKNIQNHYVLRTILT